MGLTCVIRDDVAGEARAESPLWLLPCLAWIIHCLGHQRQVVKMLRQPLERVTRMAKRPPAGISVWAPPWKLILPPQPALLGKAAPPLRGRQLRPLAPPFRGRPPRPSGEGRPALPGNAARQPGCLWSPSSQKLGAGKGFLLEGVKLWGDLLYDDR